MAEISWTDEAQRWLTDIFEYIAADNPQAAARTVQVIYDRAQDLKRFPGIGSRYTISSTLSDVGGRILSTSVSRKEKQIPPVAPPPRLLHCCRKKPTTPMQPYKPPVTIAKTGH